MRFLFGLGFGALTALSAALLMDWPPAPVPVEPVAIVPGTVESDRDSTFAETSQPQREPEALTREAAPTPKTTAAIEPRKTEQANSDPVSSDQDSSDQDSSEQNSPSVVAATSTPTPTAEVEASWRPAPAPVALSPGDPLAGAPDRPASKHEPTDLNRESTALASAPAVPQAPVSPAAPQAPGQMAVWRPFHSQLSAEGFARRLSLQLGYPFEVVKVDAAKYHVVFAYADTAQRDTLSAQLTALTGFQPR